MTDQLKSHYEKPAEMYDGLRLHQNENTAGCSPRVLEALRRITREDMGFYPPYTAATEAAARYFGVDASHVALVNGLDEGIMGACIAYLRPAAGAGTIPEAVVPEPSFEIFRFDTAVAGGRLIQVMPRPDFAFPLEEVLAAITPATRVVFVTNPNNPTGVSAPFDAIRAIARRLPKEAILFLDEAYAEFAGRSFVSDLPAFPNVVIGRTFSKAFGLAAIRIGAVIGAPEALDPIRYVVPVYSVNIAAVFAVQAALDDRDYLEEYLRQVKESKALVYAACDRLRLKCWPSDANFVLIRVGDRVADVIRFARSRGVFLRDRSNEPGCSGCLRFGAGVVEHTRRGLSVLEEALCAVR